MESNQRISPQMQQFLAAPVTLPEHDSAFGAHGFWAPGVLLMRNLRFASKALFISVIFLLPIFLLAYFFTITQNDQITFAQQERVGVAALQHLVPVYTGLLKTRNATRATLGGFDGAAKYQAARLQTDQAIAEFEKHLQQTGDVLGLKSEFEKIKSGWAATASVPNGVNEQKRTVFGPETNALRDFLTLAADKSNLVLDPDLDSFYLVNSMLLSTPELMEDVGQLWGWGTYFVASSKGGQKEISRTEQSIYSVSIAGVARGVRNNVDYVKRAYTATPEVKAKLDVAVFDDISVFFAEARDVDKLLGADGPSTEKYYAKGEAALLRLASFYDKGLPVLDGLLQQRISNLKNRLYLLLTSVILTLAFAAYFFISFFLVTRGGLRLISKHLAEIAEGDLRKPPAKPWGTDEAAGVITDLIICYDSLHGLIRRVRHSARALHAASEEISAASFDLSGRTEAAGATLEQQASSMEEIGTTVKSTAERALMAATFAQDNAQVAEEGGQVFQVVVHTMRDIQTSSTQIGDIVGVIDGIAFQTNILALNAAVEAARAGESGRGFAVVATEVRSLAQRSAAAARQIKGLIEASVQKVQGGTVVVENAGRTMTEVVINARQINVFLSEISIAAQEQADGVLLVGKSIQELDKNTQQNAALVEETTAAAEALKSQAEILQDEISNFRVA